jgi:hypothetical protein
MRSMLFASFLLCLIMACGAAGPGDAVRGFFDALQAGDGEKAASYLSQQAIDEMGSLRDYMMGDEAQIAEMAAEFGVSADELSNADDRQFVAIVLGSEMMAGEAEGLEVTIGEVTIDGDRATVQVTYSFEGDSDEDELELVKEDGGWKLTELDI